MNKTRSVKVKVNKIAHYPSFKEYLEIETLAACLPDAGIATIADGLNVYYGFYPDRAEENSLGVLAIHMSRMA